MKSWFQGVDVVLDLPLKFRCSCCQVRQELFYVWCWLLLSPLLVRCRFGYSDWWRRHDVNARGSAELKRPYYQRYPHDAASTNRCIRTGIDQVFIVLRSRKHYRRSCKKLLKELSLISETSGLDKRPQQHPETNHWMTVVKAYIQLVPHKLIDQFIF